MTCTCGQHISERAEAECRRVCIPARCSRCLCEHLMPTWERHRLGRETPKPVNPLASMSWHEKRTLHLLKSLAPEQLELFVGWQRQCVNTGYRPSFEDAFDYLNELREAA